MNQKYLHAIIPGIVIFIMFSVAYNWINDIDCQDEKCETSKDIHMYALYGLVILLIGVWIMMVRSIRWELQNNGDINK